MPVINGVISCDLDFELVKEWLCSHVTVGSHLGNSKPVAYYHGRSYLEL